MSMILVILPASDDTIQSLIRNPTKITDFIEVGEPSPRLSTWDRLRRLFGWKPEGASPREGRELDDAARECFDLDKSWHAIHFLLSGTAWEGTMPEGFLLCSGAVIGDIDVGYGPARAYTAAETASIHACLAALPPDQLRMRFDAKVLAREEIYPDIWDREDEEDVDYVLHYYKSLREFVAHTTDRGEGMVIYLG